MFVVISDAFLNDLRADNGMIAHSLRKLLECRAARGVDNHELTIKNVLKTSDINHRRKKNASITPRKTFFTLYFRKFPTDVNDFGAF